jgi:arylsulfatase A-like enzyme
MTGLHMGHSYIRDNQEVQPEGQLPIPAETVTVAKVLKEAGYATGLIGKWGLGGPGSESEPNAMGFDYFFGYNCQRKAHEYYPEYLWRNREKVVLEKNQNGQRGQYSHDLMADEALEFVKKHKDHPFFLYLPYTIPHGKYEVPDLKPYEEKDWKPQEKAYAAMITRMDRDIGRMMELLKELNLDSETLVFFASDNGPAFQGGIFNSAMGLRSFKRFLYEGGIREPMIARWPGKVPAGKVSDFQWAFWDFLPTAAELAGAKTPERLDGISVVPTLLGKEQKPHEYLYWEFYSPFQQAVRLGDWKGYRTGTKEPLELYDLSKDAAEKENVAAANPEVVQKIERIMAAAHTDSAHWKTREKAQVPEKGAAKKKAAKTGG